MLKEEEKAASEACVEGKEAEGETKEDISWEELIAFAKAEYLQRNKIKTVFGKTEEIANCDVNLAIIQEKEQKIKDEKWIKQERFNSYEEIEEIEETKVSILPQDIFVSQNNKMLKRQLILGRAGIGKSTMSQYLAYQWAKEGWWKDEPFKLLVWVPLRQLMKECIYPKGEPISLGKIVYEQYSEQLNQALFISREKCIEVLDNLISKHFSEILYMLDGFDEVANICQLNDDQTNHQAEILRLLLNQKQVVITSRPYYIEDYLASQGIKIDRRLENMGLIGENIQNYIQRYSWGSSLQKKSLQSCLNSNSLMRGIVYIPINLALLCHHWCSHQEVKAFHFSMTSLYEKLVGDFLCKYLRETFGKNYPFFDSESEREILENKAVQPVLMLLEKLAFLQMQRNTLLFSQVRVDELLKELGMSREMQIFKKVLDDGLLVLLDEKEQCFEEKRMYTFIHLTFQEFFAARYIARIFKQDRDSLEKKQSQKINNQRLEIFMQNYKYDLRYEIVWWFVAGSLKEHSSGLQKFFNSFLSMPRELSRSYDILLWIKFLEESRLTDNLSELLKKNLIKEIRKKAELSFDQHAYISEEGWSKTFLKYLFSSPVVCDKISILQTEEAVRKALDYLQCHSNLPSHVLSMVINLLSDKENDIKNLALTILDRQTNFPSGVLNALIDLVKNKDLVVSRKVLTILERQASLPPDVLSKLVNLLSDSNNDKEVRSWVGIALDRQKNSPSEVLNAMAGLLKNKGEDIESWAQFVLNQPESLPFDVLIILVTLLSNKDWDVREAAESALIGQKHLPPSVFIIVVSLLKNTSIGIRISALHVLGSQAHLPLDVLNKIVRALRDPVWAIRKEAQFALNRQANLPLDILYTLIILLREKEGDISELAQYILAHQTNLLPNILSILVDLLNDKEANIRNAALIALSGQKNLSPDVLITMISLLAVKEVGISKALQEVLSRQNNLLPNVLSALISLLSDKDKEVSRWALRVLRNQKNLPPDILSMMVSFLKDKDKEVSGWAWGTLDCQMSLPLDVLSTLKNLLSDKDERVSGWAYFTLGRQANLPLDILSALVNSLNDKEMCIRNLALRALSFQPNLPSDVLNEVVTLIVNKYQIYWTKGEEVIFICRQLFSILDNPVLQSQLSANAVLLSDVILKKNFSSKSVAYFKKDQSLVIRLGSRFKQIAIKNKNEFFQIFSKRRKLWLNSHDADYLLSEITKSLSTLSLKK